MKITVLGCNGSISSQRRTTCYRVDGDILIDAGSGAGELTLDEARAITAVFLTHAHMDHCCLLPMLIDAGCETRQQPLTIYALPETLAMLRRNIFNGEIYPDYTALPSPERPYARCMPLKIFETVTLNGRRFTALPARHSVPCAGYRADSGKASWVYSGDTTLCPEFWQALNGIENLRHLLIETTLRNAAGAGALDAGHMNAHLLAEGLRLLRRPAELNIVHMEAGHEDETLLELMAAVGNYAPRAVQNGEVFEF